MHGHQCININWTVFIMINVHDDVSKAAELRSSNRLREEVTYHLVSWAMLNGDVPALEYISNEKIPDVHVAGSLAARSSSVRFQELRAFIVLMNYGRLEGISLCLEEVSNPQDCGHILMHCHHLCLC